MLSPRAIHLFLKYFNSIDLALSRRMIRKRTWDEEALTFLLTELLDEEGQRDLNISYPHDAFIEELESSDEPLSIDVRLETHSYPKSMERYVTQSDIGLILSYQDQFVSDLSFRRGWLLQAKRLFPTKKSYESGFTLNSRFESVNKDQHKRMIALRDWAGSDFIRYMLYCPRPILLDKQIREHLCSARNQALSRDIFDYALGLELRDDLMSSAHTVAAGIYISLLESLPKTFLDLHSSLFKGVTPFSWFIVSQISQTNGIRNEFDENSLRWHKSRIGEDTNLDNPIIEGLIRGDISKIKQDDRLVKVLEDADKASILPAYTLSIRIVNGIDRPRNNNLG